VKKLSEGKKVRWIALHTKVIAVAVEGSIGDWTAYIADVPGENHDREWQKVASEGAKLRFDVAEVLFPDFAQKFSWRG